MQHRHGGGAVSRGGSPEQEGLVRVPDERIKSIAANLMKIQLAR